MAKPAPSRPEQFRRLLREASAELGLPRSHDKPQRLATVRLQRRALRELQQFDLLSGKLSDPSRLLDADDKLRVEEERLQAPSASGHDHQLTIEFVHPAQVTCPGCGLAYDPVAAQAEKDRNAKRQRELQTQATDRAVSADTTRRSASVVPFAGAVSTGGDHGRELGRPVAIVRGSIPIHPAGMVESTTKS